MNNKGFGLGFCLLFAATFFRATNVSAAECVPVDDFGRECVSLNAINRPIKGLKDYSGIWFDNICDRQVHIKVSRKDGTIQSGTAVPGRNKRAMECKTSACGGYSDWYPVCSLKDKKNAVRKSPASRSDDTPTQSKVKPEATGKRNAGLSPALQKIYSECVVSVKRGNRATDTAEYIKNDKSTSNQYSGSRKETYKKYSKRMMVHHLDAIAVTRSDADNFCYYYAKNNKDVSNSQWARSAKGREWQSHIDKQIAVSKEFFSTVKSDLQIQMDAKYAKERARILNRPSNNDVCAGSAWACGTAN